MANSRGYSFIEAIVTLGLLAIIAGFVIPGAVSRVKLEGDLNFKTELSRLASDAREKAISQNKTFHMKMLDQNGSQQIVLEADDANGNTGDPVVTVSVPSSTTPKDFQLNGQSQASDAWDLRFFPDGTSDQGGVSFTRQQITLALNVDSKGHGDVSDTLVDTSTTTWSAGSLEQRSTG